MVLKTTAKDGRRKQQKIFEDVSRGSENTGTGGNRRQREAQTTNGHSLVTKGVLPLELVRLDVGHNRENKKCVPYIYKTHVW